MSKISSLITLKKTVHELKNSGKQIVFTNGCFDIIHPGHIKLLNLAKKKGDILIIGINSDSSIKKIKGAGRPIFPLSARMKVLEAIEVVDFIIPFSEMTPFKLISILKPQILVKGGDWKAGSIVGSDLVKKVYRIKLTPKFSTTSAIKKILKNFPKH